MKNVVCGSEGNLRLYKRKHFKVSCYKIKSFALEEGKRIEIAKHPEWAQLFHKEKHAKNLMYDLFWGRYIEE